MDFAEYKGTKSTLLLHFYLVSARTCTSHLLTVLRDDMGSVQDYAQVRKDIASILDQPEYDDGSAGPVLVRYVR